MNCHLKRITFQTVKSQSAALAFIACCVVASVASADDKAPEKVTFDDHVKPLLVQRCSSCHNGQKREGDLDVTNYTNLMQGGGSGTVIEPQDAAGSYLYQLITHEETPEMPPSGTKIPDPEIQLIAKWIDLGALENSGSVAAKAKPKFDMSMSANPSVKPEVTPMPLRISLEPIIKTPRPSVHAIATSPWAPITAISSPQQILLYNTQNLSLAGVLPFEEGVAHSLRFSRNGQLLLAGGGRGGALGKTVLFNVLTGERITTVGDELESVLASDISPDHSLVAIGGPNKLVKILSTNDGSSIAEIKKHTEWVTALEFSPDGKYLASGDRNGGLHVWEADTGNEAFTLKAHSKSITGVSWRADSQILCSASEDGSIRLWELDEGKQIKSWTAHGTGVTGVEFHRDGIISSCGRDKVAKTWDQNGKMIRQFAGLVDVAVAVSHCDESNRVLASDWTGKLTVWNAVDGAAVGELASNPPTLSERLAASQKNLAVANQKHAPLAKVLEETKVSLSGMLGSLEQAKQTQAQVQTKLATMETNLTTAKTQFESASAQASSYQAELTQKSGAKPLVKESLDKAAAALALLPEDADLKASVTSLNAKIQQLDSRISELNGLAAKAKEATNAMKAAMDTAVNNVTGTKTEMQTVIAEVTKLKVNVETTQKKVDVGSKITAAAMADIQQATQQVNYWNSNLSFVAEMKSLQSEILSVEKDIAAKKLNEDTANAKLSEAQKIADDARQQKNEADAKAKMLEEKMSKLRRTL
jgi:WD40 repeat protein